MMRHLSLPVSDRSPDNRLELSARLVGADKRTGETDRSGRGQVKAPLETVKERPGFVRLQTLLIIAYRRLISRSLVAGASTDHPSAATSVRTFSAAPPTPPTASPGSTGPALHLFTGGRR